MPDNPPNPTSTPTFNEDTFAAVIAAIDAVVYEVRRIPRWTDHGRGTIVCPRCRQTLTYGWSRATQHGKLFIQGQCDTKDCVEFRS